MERYRNRSRLRAATQHVEDLNKKQLKPPGYFGDPDHAGPGTLPFQISAALIGPSLSVMEVWRGWDLLGSRDQLPYNLGGGAL